MFILTMFKKVGENLKTFSGKCTICDEVLRNYRSIIAEIFRENLAWGESCQYRPKSKVYTTTSRSL